MCRPLQLLLLKGIQQLLHALDADRLQSAELLCPQGNKEFLIHPPYPPGGFQGFIMPGAGGRAGSSFVGPVNKAAGFVSLPCPLYIAGFVVFCLSGPQQVGLAVYRYACEVFRRGLGYKTGEDQGSYMFSDRLQHG